LSRLSATALARAAGFDAALLCGAKSTLTRALRGPFVTMSAHEVSPPAQFVDAIAQAGNEVAQGWMRLVTSALSAGTPAPWLAAQSADAARAARAQAGYLEEQAKLWNALLEKRAPELALPPGDKRFSAAPWREDSYYEYLMRSYLLASRTLTELADSAGLDGQAKERLRFTVKQWIDAMSPANFIATNPQAMRLAHDTLGASLSHGVVNLLDDLHRGRISQSDESAFEVGRNLAVTPGEVIYQNELIQLIQYAPSTAEVGKRPLVMVPPCINKYYVLDLQPENSFVRHAVGAGHTVFMISWRNAPASLGQLTWDDYLEQGVLRALDVAREVSGAEQVNALGFCVGGTLLGAALAVLAAKGEDLVASVTFLTTMLDFSDTGLIGLFVDESSVAARERSIGRGGILPGSDLAFVFSALRANDLIWPYVVNNYLLGGTPPPFDILYWNADGTDLPGPMYCYYLRHTYLENKLREPGALVNCGVPVDLGKIKCPMFVYASMEDHIVPWRSAYRTLGLLGGEKTFVLGASGHIAGVINPADKNRRSHWLGAPYPEDPDAWLASASEQRGSWWPRWTAWLEAQRGGTRKAPAKAGNRKYRPIEPAPGRYVKERAPAGQE
jgi:polyhydroxyalkanoate synthase